MSEEMTTAPVTTEAAPSPAAAEPKSVAPVTESFSDIPAEFAGMPEFQGYQSTADVLKEFKTLKYLDESRKTNGMVPMIGEDTPPELVHDFYKNLGKPDNVAEYGFERPEDLPEGIDYSDERMASFAQLAFDQHLTKPQAQAVVDFYHNTVKEFSTKIQEAEAKALNDNFDALEKKWGGSVDSEAFKAKHKDAQRAFNYVADADMAAQFKENPHLSSHPLVLDLLARLGAKLGPDTVSITDVSLPSSGFGDSRSAVEKQISDFTSTGKFKEMMSNPNTEKARQLKSEWNALHAKLRELT